MKGLIPVRIALLCVLTAIFLPAIAQQPPADNCPTIVINGPDLSLPISTLIYSIELNNLNPSLQPTFKWETSAGQIIAGQGTQKIEIYPETGRSTTVTVTVGGLPASCQSQASYSMIAEPPPPKPRLIATLISDNEKAHLDAYAGELGKAPTDSAFIIWYSGRQKREEDPGKRALRAKDYLVTKHRLDPSRFVIVEGGMRESETIELWVAPQGATVPEANPPKSK